MHKPDPILEGISSEDAIAHYADMDMTPEKALAELVLIAVGHVPGDTGESGSLTADGMHSEADAILCALLVHLGHADVVRVYEEIEKSWG